MMKISLYGPNIFGRTAMPKILLILCGMFCCLTIRAQNRQTSVTGTVTEIVDGANEPLPAVTVMVQGTNVYAMTDNDGKYHIVAPDANAVLVFSLMGYKTVNEKIGARTVINVMMEFEEAKALEEVVVVGYGTQRKEAVTGSVASMRGDMVREVQTGNVTSALAGRIAGVQMSQTSSKPGADMQIRIRGVRSLSADNAPLVVLDGIPFGGTLADINPNDVKNIDILKDASATAIYGSRGAGGVIIVTTNKGTAGQKPKVSYNSYVGVKTLYHRYPMMTGDELYELRRAAEMYTDLEGGVTVPRLGLDEAKGVNTDWQDLMFAPGMVTSHDIAVSNGVETGSYNIGAGYFSDQSLLPGQDYKRFSLRANVDQLIGKYIRFGLTTNNNYSMTNGQNLGLYNTLALSPMINPYKDGVWQTRVSAVIDPNEWAYSRDAVEALGDKWADNQRVFATYNSVYGDVKIPWIDGLSYRVTVGLDYRAVNRGQYRGTGVFSNTASTASTASLSKSTYYKWTVENLLVYEKFFDKHHLTLNALYSGEQSHYDRSYVNATNISSDHFQYWNIGRAPAENIIYNPDEQDYWERALLSAMGRVMYDYDGRYMLLASMRWDGASVLAPGHKWISYPAFSAGWNIARESFMENVKWLNNLKLRAGWGLTSNQAVSPYQTLGELGNRPYNFGGQITTGYYVSMVPNAELSWEFSSTFNVGFDFNLLGNRLGGTIEYYVANTSDIIQYVNLPESGGVRGYYANIGKMENKGFELTLNGTIIDNRNGWTWEAGINLYANRNKIIELASGQERDESNAWFVGYPVNSIFDYEKIGLWQESDQHRDILEPTGNAGMIKVKYTGDYNADGTPVRQIGSADRQVISADPNWQGGFSTRVAYKNWDLNLIGTYQNGGVLVSSLHASNGYLNLLSGRRGNVKVDYWTPENTDAKYPKPGGARTNDNTRYGSTLGYFSGSYFKVGQITLGYNFNPEAGWFKRLGLNSARLYFTLQNAFVLFSPFANETGLDPVTNSYGDENAAITTDLPYNSNMLTVGTNSPQSRNFLFGLNLSF